MIEQATGAAKARQVLIICAHDDDEVIGPGGTIRQLANAGVDVSTLIFANGNEGYQTCEGEATIIQRRIVEREAAQKILGTAQCTALDYPDFSNLDREAVYRQIIRSVRETQPSVVFSHLPTDYLAHRTLSSLVAEAVWQAGWTCSLALGEPWTVHRLYLFAILELIPRPSHIVDISDTFEAKRQAMQAYASQHEVVPGILDQLEARARAYGAMIGKRYGEAFIRSGAMTAPIDNALQLLGE